MNLSKEVKQKLQSLIETHTPYQLAKELDLSKTTLYRIFNDIEVRDVRFETISKLVNYYDKLERQKLTHNLYKLRDEKILIWNRLTHCPILWTGEIKSELFDFQNLDQDDLRQPKTSPELIDYKIFEYVPNFNMVKGVVEFNEFASYSAEAMDIRIPQDDGSLKIEIDIVVTDEENDLELKKGTCVSLQIAGKLVQYIDEINEIVYWIKRLICITIEHKVASWEHKFDYVVVYPVQYKQVQKHEKYTRIHDDLENVKGIQGWVNEVVYSLEYLAKGKPYSNSVARILTEQQGHEPDSLIVLHPVLSIHQYADQYIVLLQTTYAGVVNSTQRLDIGMFTEKNINYWFSIIPQLILMFEEKMAENFEDEVVMNRIVFKQYVERV